MSYRRRQDYELMLYHFIFYHPFFFALVRFFHQVGRRLLILYIRQQLQVAV
ncbi:MAG: hypothetical protein Q8O99_02815 [bacterium]|nr:hypothetical protein [bacterium]